MNDSINSALLQSYPKWNELQQLIFLKLLPFVFLSISTPFWILMLRKNKNKDNIFENSWNFILKLVSLIY